MKGSFGGVNSLKYPTVGYIPVFPKLLRSMCGAIPMKHNKTAISYGTYI